LAAGSPSLGFLTFLVVIVLIVAGVGAGLLYEANHPKKPGSPTAVVVGDNVTVNYIGLFGSGPEKGKVFDTSIKSVAQDNVTYPKSLEYTPRNSTGYTPLPVHVGPKTAKGGDTVNGVSYGSVVTGFWEGLIGLSVNVSRSVTVPPGEGYGPLNTSCLRTAPLVQKIPVEVSYTPAAFAKAYPGVTAATGNTFTDPTYDWSDRIASANSSAVVVSRDPTAGETVKPFGWTVLVSNVTSSQITLESELTPSSVGSVLGNEAGTTVCSSTKFIVWSVDLSAGTFVENYNREVDGETLIFIVTVVTIVPP
jgi:FKBP-type peptidyl-prolyl cis-trans isomerase 2